MHIWYLSLCYPVLVSCLSRWSATSLALQVLEVGMFRRLTFGDQICRWLLPLTQWKLILLWVNLEKPVTRRRARLYHRQWQETRDLGTVVENYFTWTYHQRLRHFFVRKWELNWTWRRWQIWQLTTWFRSRMFCISHVDSWRNTLALCWISAWMCATFHSRWTCHCCACCIR